MGRRDRRRQILFLGSVALVLIAVAMLYVTAPPPTILVVRVFDDSAGVPLTGARVEVQQPGQPAMPPAITDETGTARFAHPRPDPNYSVRVQKVDYAFVLHQGIDVPESQETEVSVQVVPQPGGRLFVGQEQARLVEIDTASLLVVKTVVLPGAPDAPVRHLRVHPDEKLLYAMAGARTLVISISGAVLAQLDTGGIVDSLDVSRDGRYLLLTGTALGDASSIVAQRHLWIVDARSGALVEEAMLSRYDWAPGEGIVWQPDGTDADLLRLASPVVGRMPVEGQTLLGLDEVATGAARNPNKLIFSQDEEYLYTWRQGWQLPDTWRAGEYWRDSGQLSDVLLLISTADGSSIYREMPPGISVLALSPLGDELYALNARLGTLTILSLSGSRPQTVVPVGREPQVLTISADGRWAYVGDGEGQAIIAVDLPSAAVWMTIPLRREPLSLAVR